MVIAPDGFETKAASQLLKFLLIGMEVEVGKVGEENDGTGARSNGFVVKAERRSFG